MMQDTIWVTADKQHIPVRSMETRHIHNCIAKIQRSTRGWRAEFLERLQLELLIRSIEGEDS